MSILVENAISRGNTVTNPIAKGHFGENGPIRVFGDIYVIFHRIASPNIPNRITQSHLK